MQEFAPVSDKLIDRTRAISQKLRRLQLATWVGRNGFDKLLTRALAFTQPGILKELVIEDHSRYDISSHFAPPSVLSSMNKLVYSSYVNDNLQAITYLELKGTYFPCESPAYHGLLDLRLLTSGPHQISIPYGQLARILQACPDLRVLHFNLPIHRVEGAQLPSIPPVQLKQLEEVNLKMNPGTIYDQHALLLSLLAPGSKPLRLSLPIANSGSFACQYEDVFSSSARDFFQRSNLAELYVELTEHPGEEYKSLSFARLLSELPAGPAGLSILGLDSFYESERDANLLNVTSCPTKIDTLILCRSDVYSTSLRKFVEICSVHKAVVRACDDYASTYKDLASIFPLLKYSKDGPGENCPLDEWVSRGHLNWC